MSKELVISSNAHETKVAIVEDDQLVEIYFQRANEYSLAGSIHKGRVTRVLPGMQSAFVDLGLERDTFLYVSDFFEESGEDFDRVEERPSGRGGRDRQDRQDRGGERGGNRSDRGERSEKPEQAAIAAVGLVQPPPEIAVAPEPAEIVESEPTRPPSADRFDDDSRDRRGRRSRRRRSRGRGFPDSKYASDLSAGPESESEPESAETEEPAEVFLLPGESLAKYRRPASTTSATEVEEEDELPSFESDEPSESEATALSALSESESVAAVSEAAVEPELALDEPPLTESAGDAAEPDVDPENEQLLPVTDNGDEEVQPEEETIIGGEDFSQEELGELISEAAEDAQADLSEADLADVELVESELADTEVPETELAEPDADDAPVSESEAEPQPLATLEGNGEEQAATASVREQSGRYQHRQSRRMRRKQRGEARSEGRESRDTREVREPRESREPREVREPQPVAEADRQARSGDKPPLPSISDLLKEGQEIIVQIAKEPLGQKGARITSHIALPGRFVVFMPTLEHLGVSRKIASDEERLRLKKILQNSRAGITGGFIVRTAGEGRTEEEIASDMQYLYNLWLDIRSKAEKRKAPVLLHHDLDIVQRILRDQLSDMFKSIWIDNEEVYESVLRFMQRFQPSLVGRVKMYTRPAPIFDAFNVTQEIEKALRPKVWLKSGGYIVINQTEALVAIDVNTGKYVGKSNRLEDTITRTNTEAVKEIVRQIRLRDLGGIIVVDFIDMDERKNRQKVMQALEDAMRADRAPYKILQFNDFGLVAITRKRVKQSLERSLCSPCPVCEGAGYTKSVNTVVGEIIQEATKIRQNIEGKNVVLRVYPEVAKFLKSNTNDQLEEIESILGRPVMVMSDPMLSPDKFDLAW